MPIARECGCSLGTVRAAVRRLHLEDLAPHVRPPAPPCASAENLRTLYVDQAMSLESMAKALGTSRRRSVPISVASGSDPIVGPASARPTEHGRTDRPGGSPENHDRPARRGEPRLAPPPGWAAPGASARRPPRRAAPPAPPRSGAASHRRPWQPPPRWPALWPRVLAGLLASSGVPPRPERWP